MLDWRKVLIVVRNSWDWTSAVVRRVEIEQGGGREMWMSFAAKEEWDLCNAERMRLSTVDVSGSLSLSK